MAVNVDMPSLLSLLACPFCRSALTFELAEVRCTGCGRGFAVNGRVPVLSGSDISVHRPSFLGRLLNAILGDPRLYDFHQAHGGGRPIAAHVQKELHAIAAGATLLDVGSGTGMVGGVVPTEARYVWLDNDPMKLRGLLSKTIDCYAVLGDATRLPFADRAIDWTSMVEVSHHLPDGALRTCLEEVARVTRDRFVFVDGVRGHRLRSKVLWQLDRGRFPRSQEELVLALEASFELEKVERFRVNHDHLLCVCSPRPDRRLSSAR
jgi:SAM-dependent methyltransferase/uncharacterized protein YbaR (Trm112 family)